MNTRTALRRTGFALAVTLATIATCPAAFASSHHDADGVWLKRTLAAQETALSHAYNTCNLHALRADLFAGTRIKLPDGRRIDPVIEARDRICGKLQREVVKGSLVVRAVGSDSALVSGEQRFCAVGTDPCTGATSRFVTLWSMHAGQWRMGRMLRFPERTGSRSAAASN